MLAARHRPGGPQGKEPWIGEGEGLVGQDRFLYGFTRGWTGIVSERGRGAVCRLDPAQVSCLYNWLSGSATGVTMEWIYSKFAVAPGASWATEYQVLPLAGMPRLDGAGGGAAGAIVRDGEPEAGRPATVRATLFSGASGRYALRFQLRRLGDAAAEAAPAETRTLALEKAQAHTEAFAFTLPSEGTFLLRFELADAQWNPLFDMEAPVAAGSAPGGYERGRNFEPQGEEMARFRAATSRGTSRSRCRGRARLPRTRSWTDHVTRHCPGPGPIRRVRCGCWPRRGPPRSARSSSSPSAWT